MSDSSYKGGDTIFPLQMFSRTCTTNGLDRNFFDSALMASSIADILSALEPE